MELVYIDRVRVDEKGVFVEMGVYVRKGVWLRTEMQCYVIPMVGMNGCVLIGCVRMKRVYVIRVYGYVPRCNAT